MAVDRPLDTETLEKYEQRVEEIEARRKRTSTIERFERRIQEIEEQIKPQLDELRALEAGLSRLRQDGDAAVDRGACDGPAHGNSSRSPARQTAAVRRRR